MLQCTQHQTGFVLLIGCELVQIKLSPMKHRSHPQLHYAVFEKEHVHG
jgi:hypothetical protein